MFPDCVFLESDNREALAAELSNYPVMGRLLGDGEYFSLVSSALILMFIKVYTSLELGSKAV